MGTTITYHRVTPKTFPAWLRVYLPPMKSYVLQSKRL